MIMGATVVYADERILAGPTSTDNPWIIAGVALLIVVVAGYMLVMYRRNKRGGG